MRRLSKLDLSFVLSSRCHTITCSGLPKIYSPIGLRSSGFHSSARLCGEEPSFTENLRRKIWGTDRPPGLVDPYSKQSESNRVVEDSAKDLPASSRNEASEEIEGPLVDDYTPATTWDGLEVVGDYSDENSLEDRDSFKSPPFSNQPRAWFQDGHIQESCISENSFHTPRKALWFAIHQSLFEVAIAHQASIPLWRVSNIPTWTYDLSQTSGAASMALSQYPTSISLIESDRTSWNLILNIMNSPRLASKESKFFVRARSSSNEEKAVLPAQQIQTSELTASYTTAWTSNWLETEFTESHVKLAIIKRIIQLTGLRIPDPIIQQSINVKSLLENLLTLSKPQKLAAKLKENSKIVNLPNLTIFDRRITPIDKEKKIGRWKVVEKELEARELLVTGHL
ncbi:MAG: hypothetical protein M1829_000382 [Trizodia sp. TS-e1964]|nr:MAG: hypothetical protein M1829_000382 [Trizodia sp. TS-e1964]